MTLNGWLQILFYSLCVLLVAKPLGVYLVRVYDGSSEVQQIVISGRLRKGDVQTSWTV